MRKFLLIIGIIAILCSRCPVSAAQEQISALFNEGNTAYKGGDYEKAVQSYLTLLTSYGVQSPQVFFNLGNAYFKERKFGYAILFYEKAQRLSPRDRDIAFNLTFVRETAGREMGSSIKGGSHILSTVCTVNELTVLVSVLYFAFTVLLVLYFFRKEEKYLWVLCVTGLFFLIGLSLLGIRIYQSEFQSSAIVVAPSAELRMGPDLHEHISCIVPEGSKVQILGKQEEWLEVSLPARAGGENSPHHTVQGWIPEKDLMTI